MKEFFAELLGTMFLILLGDAVVANVVLNKTKGNSSGWIVISLAWGLAVYVGIVVAGPYSGAHLNPAVTTGLAVAGVFPWAKVWYYIIAQMLGGAIGAFLVWVFYYHHFNQTEGKMDKLNCFCTSPAIAKTGNNFLSEIIGTFVLLFFILSAHKPFLQADNLQNVEFGLGAIGGLPVALLVTVIGLSLGGTTGYAINPARDLSPRFMHSILPMKNKGDSNWSYGWIPVIGPLCGAVIAAILYLILPLK
ncbi:MAG: MIP/aquaporin family protein [Bacteroidales bacterium]